MKVKMADGQLYDVKWRRFRKTLTKNSVKNTVLAKPAKFLTDTFCTISIIDETKEKLEKYKAFSVGSALQSKKDLYNKVFGRKLSFTRALKKFKRKKDRTIFWDTYKKCCHIV